MVELLADYGRGEVPRPISPLDKLAHFLQGGVFNNVSALSVQDLASEEAPKYLKHKL